MAKQQFKPVEVPSIIQLLDKFPDEEAARTYFERQRWGNNPTCAFCGQPAKRMKSRVGYLRCTADGCRKQFTVRVGTVMEASKISYRKWLLAMHLFHVNRKGVSSLALSKEIGVTQKTAWFMAHRIREAMAQKGGALLQGQVEVDETYLGGRERNKPDHKRMHGPRGPVGKQAVMGAKQRGGAVVAKPVAKADADTATRFIVANVGAGSTLQTDQSRIYGGLAGLFYCHQTVNHSAGVYVQGNAHTNSIEGFWSLLKRAYHGVHHHWDAKHTHRYVNEHAFRASKAGVELPGMVRLRRIMAGAVGKRLTYKRLTA